MKYLYILIIFGELLFSVTASDSCTRNICYENYGCFSTGGDFCDSKNRPIQLLPQSETKLNVKFFLYTRKNSQTAQLMNFNNNDNSKTNFNGNSETKIFIHGFTDNGNNQWMENMRSAFLRKGDFNVIQMHWADGARLPYTQATANTRMAGAILARFMKVLESSGANLGQFHLLGHSLGSHIAGYAGERLNNRLGRITGMDPAGPYFQYTKPAVRLDPTDAKFVDVIHTDGDKNLLSLLRLKGFGVMQPVGHVDFYPNGGERQPSCPITSIIEIILKGIPEGGLETVGCSHNRVLLLVTESITSNCQFKAFECDNYEDFKNGKCTSCGSNGSRCASMGLNANNYNPNGRTGVKMYLNTNGETPFCSQ